MKQVPFKASKIMSVGTELEYQIIDPLTYDMIARAKELIRNIADSEYQLLIKPEITQSMIEINSSIHPSANSLYQELQHIRAFLLDQAEAINILFCGGGTHPFQKWTLRKIFPTNRFKNLSHQYRYLSKRSTVFGQHTHVGCQHKEDAIYLTHALARFVPQFIALSASSPFYQSIDTGFQTTRTNIFNAFPSSGYMPYLLNWQEFSYYYYKLFKLGIISSMKDLYWDIRPKPEFGTVEIRVCDTPLTIERAAGISAYIQSIAHYLLQQRSVSVTQDLYYFYNYNRFQASRYGYEGDVIDADTLTHRSIAEDITDTLEKIREYAEQLQNWELILPLYHSVQEKQNDAVLLKQIYKECKKFPEVVHQQCLLWKT